MCNTFLNNISSHEHLSAISSLPSTILIELSKHPLFSIWSVTVWPFSCVRQVLQCADYPPRNAHLPCVKEPIIKSNHVND